MALSYDPGNRAALAGLSEILERRGDWEGLIQIHEARTEYEQAAEFFESLKRFPAHSLTADAIYNAGAIRMALGKHAAAKK